MIKRSQRGDTIIEVILAVSILSLITVSAFTVMQRSTAGAYDSMERSVVRLRLNEQIELLNYFRDAYAADLAAGTIAGGVPVSGSAAEKWKTISDLPNSTVPTLQTCAAPTGSFYIARGASQYLVVTSGITAATGLPSAGNGIWVASVETASAPKKKYQEFYVVACWPTTTNGQSIMSSVVRLYDPS